MKVDVVIRGLSGTSVRGRIAAIVEERLSRYAGKIREIRVWALDENGSKPGGKRCRIRIRTSVGKSLLLSRSGERLKLVLLDALDVAQTALCESQKRTKCLQQRRSETIEEVFQ